MIYVLMDLRLERLTKSNKESKIHFDKDFQCIYLSEPNSM